jgi:hypothetical protein
VSSDVEKAQNVKNRLDKNGRRILLVREGIASSDPSKPWRKTTDFNADTYPTVAVFINYETKEIDGQLIKSFDKKLLVNAIDNEGKDLTKYDAVIDDGETWKIEKVNPLQPGGVVIMYEIQIRK